MCAYAVYWFAMTDTLSTSNTSTGSGLSSFALKVVAIVGMALNHSAYIFYPYLPTEALCVMFAVGGVTFPVMAYLLVEGYQHTSNVRRYGIRLFVFALISQVPFWLFLAPEGNVLFPLLIGLAALYLYDHMKNRVAFWLVFAALTALSIHCDWGILGPLIIIMMRAIPNRRQRIILPLLLPIVGYGLPALSDFVATLDLVDLPFALYPLIGCTSAIPLLLAYNGSRGRPMKWFFYAFYPAHILILGLAKGLLLNDWTPGL